MCDIYMLISAWLSKESLVISASYSSKTNAAGLCGGEGGAQGAGVDRALLL